MNVMQSNGNVGKGLLKGVHDLGKLGEEREIVAAYIDLARQAGRDGATSLERAVELRDDLPALLQEEMSFRGELDIACIPDQERKAEVVLHPFDRAADRGLRRVKQHRCLAEMELLGNRDENPCVSDIPSHAGPPLVFAAIRASHGDFNCCN